MPQERNEKQRKERKKERTKERKKKKKLDMFVKWCGKSAHLLSVRTATSFTHNGLEIRQTR